MSTDYNEVRAFHFGELQKMIAPPAQAVLRSKDDVAFAPKVTNSRGKIARQQGLRFQVTLDHRVAPRQPVPAGAVSSEIRVVDIADHDVARACATNALYPSNRRFTAFRPVYSKKNAQPALPVGPSFEWSGIPDYEDRDLGRLNEAL
jgi:hypothetical protein